MNEKIETSSKINWMHLVNPSHEEIEKIADEYDFHELIVDDLTETGTQDKIDVYDDYLFLVIHFPKFDKVTGRYVHNEFNIVLGKNFIVSTSRFNTSQIAKIKDSFHEDISEAEPDEKYMNSPYYILYKLVDGMYDKVLKSLSSFTKEVMTLEDEMFETNMNPKGILEDLVTKRRNSIFLKSIFMPQGEIIDELHDSTLKFFGGEFDVYFEDLAYKIDKISNQVTNLYQNIGSLADTYNTLTTIETNKTVGVLTIFTAIVGTMTFVTGLYGMNVKLPL